MHERGPRARLAIMISGGGSIINAITSAFASSFPVGGTPRMKIVRRELAKSDAERLAGDARRLRGDWKKP